jgi:hypothetical protein
MAHKGKLNEVGVNSRKKIDVGMPVYIIGKKERSKNVNQKKKNISPNCFPFTHILRRGKKKEDKKKSEK